MNPRGWCRCSCMMTTRSSIERDLRHLDEVFPTPPLSPTPAGAATMRLW
jgi:hypothetical protein